MIYHYLSHIALAIFNFGVLAFAIVSLLALNLFTFFLYFLDKRRAIRRKWRIPEKILILATLSFGGLGAVLGMFCLRHKTRKIKFKIAGFVGVLFFLIPFIHIVHGLTLDRIVRFVEVPFYSQNWPAALDGYRIAFMADFHVITDEDMAAIINELNTRDIDLLLHGGDFTRHDSHYQNTLAQMAHARTTHGIMGVRGNHDFRIDLRPAKAQHGMVLLENEGIEIAPGFFVAGVTDLWYGRPDLNAATQNAGDNDFVLLISHNPDIGMRYDTDGIDLVLAGHTHGGQMTFFGYPIYLHRGSITDYGTRFARGFAQYDNGVPVFTTVGVGDYYNLPRIFNRPEVIIFSMHNK